MKPEVLALALLAVLLAVTQQAHGDGAPVKLCGRDFVRAIVFTCGGSRWRRHADDYAYVPAAESAEASPFAAAAEAPAPGEQEGAGGRAAALERREAAKLLTTACCSVGCSEKDISALC
ncbi:insulin-like peptide INSL5 [Nothoprocta perdicaria]|uniref:insulin-like peptide INSL5 n=1 Tax=Nothoprocta perdicaria TaxID=30464 RepID=UPI000E1BDAEC|nr:insulin-like peptide INSL5 [Nothoprocta perdicaria]